MMAAWVLQAVGSQRLRPVNNTVRGADSPFELARSVLATPNSNRLAAGHPATSRSLVVSAPKWG